MPGQKLYQDVILAKVSFFSELGSSAMGELPTVQESKSSDRNHTGQLCLCQRNNAPSNKPSSGCVYEMLCLHSKEHVVFNRSGRLDVTCSPHHFLLLPNLIENLKPSPDEERAISETLATIQSSSLYVYESTKSREAENYSDSSWVPMCAGDLFW